MLALRTLEYRAPSAGIDIAGSAAAVRGFHRDVDEL
jgi:hypothetical protein